jgi:hypothetical protein
MDTEGTTPWTSGIRGVALAPAPAPAPVSLPNLPVRAEAPQPETATSDAGPAPSSDLAKRRISLALAIVEVLVGLRAALKLLGANPHAGFTRLLDALTTPLVLPFRGVFADPGGSRSVIEVSSLLALAIYAIVAWIAVRVLLVVRDWRSASGS